MYWQDTNILKFGLQIVPIRYFYSLTTLLYGLEFWQHCPSVVLRLSWEEGVLKWLVWFAQHIGKLFHILFFKVVFYVKLFHGKILSWTILVERLQLARLMTLVLEISRWPTWLPLFQACAKNFMAYLEKWWWGSYSTEVIIQTCLLILRVVYLVF